MTRIALRHLSMAAIGIAMTACTGPPADDDATATYAEREPTPATTTCSADASWITNPAFPSEVAPEQSLCNFEQFAWQSLLYLVQPTPDDRDVLEFETWMSYYGIFVGANETPTPYGDHPPDPCTSKEAVRGLRIGAAPFFYSSITKQAGVEHALIAPDGNLAWYGLRVNKDAYDMLTQCNLYQSNCAGQLMHGNTGIDVVSLYPNLAFPDGAVELKTAWKVLSGEDARSGRFYTVQGQIQPDETKTCQPVALGLVGMHIVAKTPDFPAFIWASFEHRNNAPDCTDLSASPPLGGSWNFFDPATCDNCTTNLYDPPNPTQVCRMHPQGDSTIGTFPNGQDCTVDPSQFACQETTKTMLAESTAAIQQINASAQALITNHSDKIDPVWANYELVGNVWTRDQVITPPQLQAQVGSLSAANASMETYVQNGEAGATATNNCFSCHDQSYQFGSYLPPAGLSHIFVKGQPDTGGCQDGSLPATCAPYIGAENSGTNTSAEGHDS